MPQRADKRTGVCFMPQFEIMSVPFYTVREDDSQGTTHGQSQWQETPQRVRRREEKVPLCNDGRKVKRIGRRKQFMTGQENIIVTWTILHLLTCHTSQLGKSDQGVKSALCSNSMMDHIQSESQVERIFHQQLAHLELSNANKDG